MDTRFDPVRIIATDRLNNRVVHLSLDGAFLGVVNDQLLLPAALTIDGDKRDRRRAQRPRDDSRQGWQGRDARRDEHGRRNRHESRAAGPVADGLRDRGARRGDECARRHLRCRVQHVRRVHKFARR